MTRPRLDIPRLRPARLLGALLAASLLLGPSASFAHRRIDPSAAPLSGLDIPNLTHGEMAVVAEHAPAIRRLAQSVVRTDPTFRRLLNHAALQRATCLWVIVPGSLTDEDSPFNECAHAYLATLRALLAHMREMPDRKKAARALDDALQQEMTRRNAASVLCAYSGEAFSTAEVIRPRLRDIVSHPPTLMAFAGGFLMLGAGLSAVFVARQRRD